MEDVVTIKLNKWPFKYLLFISIIIYIIYIIYNNRYLSIIISNIYSHIYYLFPCEDPQFMLSTSDAYLMLSMDLYWFLHSTMYLTADFIKFLENKIVVNWELLRLASWPAVIFLFHLFCSWLPTAMWLFSFRSNQIWSVTWRCISEWQRWGMRWVYAAGMLLPGKVVFCGSVMVWVMALQKAC